MVSSDKLQTSAPATMSGRKSDATTPKNDLRPGYEANIQAGNKDLNVDLQSVPVTVESVKIDGLRRTKSDYVHSATKDILRAKDFGDLILKIGETQNKLKQLDAFSSVETLVDTSKSPGASRDGYEITFLVEESKALSGGVWTMIGANEGSVNVGLKLPNLLGRGEKLSIDHVLSSSYDKNSALSFSKPFPNSGSSVTSTLFYKRSPHIWSGFNDLSLGTLLGYNFSLPNKDTVGVQWKCGWRQLTSLPVGQKNSTSTVVREQLGHSVKSSVQLIYKSDNRDQLIFPSKGLLKKVTVELAGLTGDAKFLKSEAEFQYNFPVVKGVILQTSLRGGMLKPISSSRTSCNIADYFFLGGPQTLRGFSMWGVGPKSGSNCLGGKAYWSSAIHLFAPLPFINSKVPFADSIRAHTFLNWGSIGDSLSDENLRLVRASYGIGLAMSMARMARIELNYCWPFRTVKGDEVNKGMQFGIGLEFL